MTQAVKPDAGASLRIGVIGVGVMGSNHARVLTGLPGAELVGVADPDLKQADFVARTLGCTAVATVDELLDLKVDAVTIAAPTHLHRDIALACIARGVHVMVEKPIASSVEEGREIIAAARRAGVTLMVGHVERFNPAVEAIKEAIRNEDILSIAITRVGPFPPRMSNVGVVIDLAVHDIDLIRWFTDSDIVEVQPQLSSAVAEREDIALLQFRTASGVLAHINTNWLTPFKARNVTVADPRQIRDGRSAHPAGDRMFRLPAGRQLFHAPSVGWARRAAALRTAVVPARRALGIGGGGDRGGGRRQPRDRHPLSCVSSGGGAGATAGAARRGRLTGAIIWEEYESAPSPPMIPFIDVAAQRRRLGGAVDAAVARVLSHCQFILGPEVRAFEAELAKFCGAKHAVTCASGTDALVLALRARGIGPGDAVICPSFTFCATAEVVALVGATPVFVDVDAATFNIDVSKIPGAIAVAKCAGLMPKAIIPVDLFGLAADHARCRRGRRSGQACSFSTTPRRRSARLSTIAVSAHSAMPPRPVSSPPSRSAAMAMAAR